MKGQIYYKTQKNNEFMNIMLIIVKKIKLFTILWR